MCIYIYINIEREGETIWIYECTYFENNLVNVRCPFLCVFITNIIYENDHTILTSAENIIVMAAEITHLIKNNPRFIPQTSFDYSYRALGARAACAQLCEASWLHDRLMFRKRRQVPQVRNHPE